MELTDRTVSGHTGWYKVFLLLFCSQKKKTLTFLKYNHIAHPTGELQ
jgi:hypothetical protein